MSLTTIVGPVTVSLVVAWVLTPLVAAFARKMGVLDRPVARKVHTRPTPLLGGVAIWMATGSGLLMSGGMALPGRSVLIFAVGSVLLFLGILDDLGKVHHQVKLMVAMPASAAVFVGGGLTVPLGDWWLSAAITAFWVVGIVAAFSILDHMDGLCAGVAAVAAVAFAALGWVRGDSQIVGVSLALAGSAAGFLAWNWHPARIFMGDGGALFLGVMLAGTGLLWTPPDTTGVAGWLLPVVVLGVPIFDTTLVTVSRARRGLLPFATPGKDHTAHRLTNQGLGTRPTVALTYLTGVLLGGLALVLLKVSGGWILGLVSALCLVGCGGVVYLERVHVDSDIAAPPPLEAERMS